MDHPGSIGKYDLEEFLGGGMSHVYRARDRVLGRTVCIKVLTPQGSADQEVRNRFLQEARMAGNFCHDNVVSIYDFGEDNGNPFLVMEYLRGDTLRTLMKEKRVGSLRDILQIAFQLANALECVHQQNIIHRDVKPENVHINSQRTVKLMDFGIAKAHGLSMTQAGFVLGTPYYMAPEQVRGEEITKLVDVYAFGVLLYELLTGQRPFKAETTEAIFYSILSESPDPAALQRASVPVALQNLVLRCMSKPPEDRPQSFTDIASQLAALIPAASDQGTDQESTVSMTGLTAADETPAAKRPSQLGWWIAATLAIILAGGALLFVLKPRPVQLPRSLSTRSGMMVLVPAGNFLKGEFRQAKGLPDFYIDKTEVSNASYSAFCAETGCAKPAGDPQLPVVNITFEDAKRFAAWAGERLPSDDEWEKAARGTDGRTYPWGKTWNSGNANVNGTTVAPVDAYEQGASPYGALNMAGNVWEFVNSSRKPNDMDLEMFKNASPTVLSGPWVAMRGGSFRDNMQAAVTWEWADVPANFSAPTIGFRCVKDPAR